MTDTTFEGFDYDPHQIKCYLFASGIFSLLFYEGMLLHFSPPDCDAFYQWLNANNVRDVHEVETTRYRLKRHRRSLS